MIPRRTEVEGFAADALRACLGRGRTAAADVYVKQSHFHRIFLGNGLDRSTEGAESGFAVRLFRGDGRVGHAFAAEVGDPDALSTAVDAAASLAERCDPGIGTFPPGAWDAPDLDLYDPAVEQVSAVKGLLERIEKSVREECRGEVEIESLFCVAGNSYVALHTSAGFIGAYPSSLVTLILTLRAARGGQTVFDRSVVAARHLAALDADRIGREAARRVRLPLGAEVVSPGPVRAALEPRVACLLVEHLAGSLVDQAAERGRSTLAAGAAIGPDVLTIVDDASLPRGIGSTPFDGEGRPTVAWRLVDRGALGPLLGAATGPSGACVGAAQRASYSDPPRRAPSNLHFARGESGVRGLLAGAGSVLRVTGASLLGRGGPASGEVVLTASGERVESGEAIGGFRDVTLVGRIGDMLRGVQGIGNDLSFHLRGASLGSPTVLVDGMWVA